jgi:hypothetical protein
MGPARPVVRLPGWLFEILLHPARFELIEQGAVVEQRVPAAALSVAGNLSAFDCQIRDATDLQARDGECPDQATQYQPVA